MLKYRARVSALGAAMTLTTAQVCVPGDGLKVHERGTFTSIAGTDGVATAWLALSGPNDLPCFITHSENNGSLKAGLIGTVRMETPVLYFYAPREVTLAAEVRFPQGLITEWYPRADLAPTGGNLSNGSHELRNGA